MHADESHNDKPGFFSKIFGHDDTTQSNPAPTDAVVVDPAASTANVSDETTTPAVDPTASQPAYADVELQSGSMSDVHAVPTGAGAALDLSASTVTQPEADQSDSSVDQSATETFELPQLNTPVQPEVPVSVEEPAAPVLTDATPEPNTETEDKTEVLFDSTQAAAEIPATEPEISVASDAPTTDVMPPAPPVDEGLAWSANQPKSETPVEPSEATENAAVAEDGTQAELQGAQDDVDSILASHPDMTTDSASEDTPKPVEPISPISVSDKKTDESRDSIAAADQVSQRTATVARLQGHIDELETGLQKVRDELESLKS